MLTARSIFDRLKQARAAKAAAALAQFLGGGGATVPADVYDDRYGKCKACPHFQASDYPTCAVCGCFLKVKCRFPAEACPLPQPQWVAAEAAQPSDACITCPQ